VEGVSHLLKHHYTILADDMGLGKTTQAIVAAMITGERIIVVCPAYIRKNLQREVYKIIKKFRFVHMIESGKDIASWNEGHDIAIISYSLFYRMKHRLKFYGTWIFDECHYLKNPSSGRTKEVYKMLDEHIPKRVMLLSGTPAENYIHEYYSLLAICSANPKDTSGLDIIKNYPTKDKFLERFCNRVLSQHNRGPEYHGVKNIPLLIKYFKGKYLRRETADVHLLPSMNSQFVKIITEVSYIDLAWELLEAGDLEEIHPPTEKRLNAMAKVPECIKFVKDILSQGEKVVVFTDHPDAAKLISEGIKNSAYIIGGMSDKKRDKVNIDFQEGDLRCAVLTYGAGAAGLNWTAGRITVLSDITYKAKLIQQAKKRTNRMGQNRDCLYYYLVSSEIDEMIIRKVESKIKDLNKLESQI